MKKKINLDRIIFNHIDTSDMLELDIQALRNGFKQFGEQILQLAAENASIKVSNYKMSYYTSEIQIDDYTEAIIDKQLILDTIHQVE